MRGDRLFSTAFVYRTIRSHLAIELGKRVGLSESEKIGRYPFRGCSWKELLELIEKIRLRVAREAKWPVEIISYYEAGYDGF